MWDKVKKPAAAVVCLVLLACLAFVPGCAVRSNAPFNFDANKVEIKIAGVQKMPGGLAYQLILRNNSGYSLKHTEVFLSYAISDTRGGMKDNPFKVLAQSPAGLTNIIKPGEVCNFTVFAPIAEVFGDNGRLDFAHPFLEVRGYVLNGRDEMFFMKQERDMAEWMPEYKTETADLNGDGVRENIVFLYNRKDCRYTLTINGVAVNGFGDNLEDSYEIVDINKQDNFRELAVSEAGPSADYETTYYYYDGKNIVNMGEVPAGFSNVIRIDGQGRITASTRAKILQTWSYYSTYKLTDRHRLEKIPQDLYKTDYPYSLKVIKPLTLQKSRTDGRAAFVLQPGEKITLLGTDDIQWCLAQNSRGQQGWFAVQNYSDIKGVNRPAAEYFEGLSNAD